MKACLVVPADVTGGAMTAKLCNNTWAKRGTRLEVKLKYYTWRALRNVVS